MVSMHTFEYQPAIKFYNETSFDWNYRVIQYDKGNIKDIDQRHEVRLLPKQNY